MLTLEQAIITRINAEVPAFVTVANASVLAGLRDIGTLLPGCFVIPGGGDPVQQAVQTSAVTLEVQEWHVIIIVPHQHNDSADGITETVAGSLMLSVLKALQGQKLSVDQRLGFVYQGREQPSYNLGYAEFPMTFAAQMVIGN